MLILQVATAAGRRVRKVLVVPLSPDERARAENPGQALRMGSRSPSKYDCAGRPYRRPGLGMDRMNPRDNASLTAGERAALAGLEAKTAAEDSLLARRLGDRADPLLWPSCAECRHGTSVHGGVRCLS